MKHSRKEPTLRLLPFSHSRHTASKTAEKSIADTWSPMKRHASSHLQRCRCCQTGPRPARDHCSCTSVIPCNSPFSQTKVLVLTKYRVEGGVGQPWSTLHQCTPRLALGPNRPLHARQSFNSPSGWFCDRVSGRHPLRARLPTSLSQAKRGYPDRCLAPSALAPLVPTLGLR